MMTKIETTKDVEAFAAEIVREGVSFHPDDDFNSYVSLETNERTYSEKEASLRNKLMEDCFIVCENEGVDIYSIMLEVTLIETGMNKYIPLPSAQYSV